MKNQLLFLCFISLLSINNNMLFAQQISFADDTVTSSGLSSDYEIIANNQINNLTGNDLTIVWKRVTNNLPNGWTSSVCDKMQCWQTNVETKSFTLPANRSEKLDVHFFPNNATGNGITNMIAYVQGDSANTVINATFKSTATPSTSIAPIAKKNLNISVYPNPVKDYMFVNGLLETQSYKVEIYSILGSKIASYNLPVGTAQNGVHEVDMQDLPKGVFMVRIMDKNMNLLFNKSVSKMK